MAIGTSCYIRDIPSNELKLLKKLSQILDEKNATSIFLRLPQAYFDQSETIEEQHNQIIQLKGELEQQIQELDKLKSYVKQYLESEATLLKHKNSLKEFI